VQSIDLSEPVINKPRWLFQLNIVQSSYGALRKVVNPSLGPRSKEEAAAGACGALFTPGRRGGSPHMANASLRLPKSVGFRDSRLT
jgi:hypothetical protein